MIKIFKHKKTGEIMSQTNGCMRIGNVVIEGNPDLNFWDEIYCDDVKLGTEKKEAENKYSYKILSFYAKNISGKGENHVDAIYVWLETNDGRWSRLGHMTSPYTTSEIMSNKNYGILSVVRLIDGQVFRIGDTVNTPSGKNFKILEFYLDCNGEKMLCNGKTGNGHIGIHKVTKLNKIFTSEDGVDIFKGDLVTPVNMDTLKVHATTPINNGESLKYGNYKHFSSEEEANKFVLIHNPCLSISDVQSIYVSAKEGYKKNGDGQEYFAKLMEIVKKKIKK